MTKTKNALLAIIITATLLVLLGIAGRGDYNTYRAEVCYNATHQTTCGQN